MKKLILIFFTILCPVFVSAVIPENPMVIIIASYNNSEWYKRNLDSVFCQKYCNYRIIYIDDCSSDGTGELVHKYIRKSNKENKVTLIRNQTRLGSPLANQYNAICNYTEDEEIIVIMDGDDWFYNNKSLKRINKEYVHNKVWLTHGSLMEWPNGRADWCLPVPTDLVKTNNFRSYRCPSHTRTFYSWLFKRIKYEDLLYKGEFYGMAGDLAQMFPMIEMAGDRHAFIPINTYVYNVASPISENKVNLAFQNKMAAYIRALPKYNRLKAAPAHLNL